MLEHRGLDRRISSKQDGKTTVVKRIEPQKIRTEARSEARVPERTCLP